MIKDLTVGKPERVLWKFSLPLLGSILFQQLYNIADSLVAGKFVGENALAAVGNSYEITLIFIAFAFGCNIGSSVVIAKLFGAKRWNDVKTAVNTTLIASAALCAVLMLLGFLLCPALLRVINTPDEIFADSRLYLNIYIGGLIFLFLYNIATGIFSALGDSTTPFVFLAISSVSNIFVDILFVTAFHMGVAGVAWATFLCQAVSCVLAVAVVFRRLRQLPSERAPLFSGRLLGEITRIAIPSILQQSFISVGNILIQSIINGYGAPVIAGYAAAIKLNNMIITSFTALANGMSNFTAQNLGAKLPDRVREGFCGGAKMVYALAIPVAALYVLASEPLIRLFMTDASALALQTGISFLRIVSPFYLVVNIKLIADGVLRGSGAMRHFMIGTFTDLILRVVLAFILSATPLGANGIWMSWPIGWSIATAVSLVFYKKGVWKRM
ncbi:MAG: MATE family efflux transporter [Candidatus Faecivicinus sp.]